MEEDEWIKEWQRNVIRNLDNQASQYAEDFDSIKISIAKPSPELETSILESMWKLPARGEGV